MLTTNIEDLSLREEVIATACALNTTGLSIGTSGNVSVRVPGKDAILITPSGYPYEKLTPQDLVECDLHTGTEKGLRSASIEKWIHLLIMQEFRGAHAVVHTDSHYARRMRHDVPLCEHMVRSFGGNSIRCTPEYENPGTRKLAEAALAALKGRPGLIDDSRTGCYLRRHGFVAYGKTLSAALIANQWGEDIAKGWYEDCIFAMLSNRKLEYLGREQEDELNAIFKNYQK